MPKIVFTVTNDLNYDQRMHRICGSLAAAGYDVLLVGRQWRHSLTLRQQPFKQKRLKCIFNKGLLFYAEYNLRLFFYLLGTKADAICSIDLDTILPGLLVSKLKGCRRIYDAHEYFTELKEVRTRPLVKTVWTGIEKFAVPQYRWGYTVSQGLAEEFEKRYQIKFIVIRNLPLLQPLQQSQPAEKILIYQGAVNEGRGFEYLIPAMRQIPFKLVICGDGNFMEKLKLLIAENGVGDKIELKGMLLPEALRTEAAKATLGIALAEKDGVNQYHALPNKFLEYMHTGLPQIAMNFPEYRRINNRHHVAVLLNNLDVNEIARVVTHTMNNDDLLKQLRENALRAREEFCWQKEEQLLINFYKQVFS